VLGAATSLSKSAPREFWRSYRAFGGLNELGFAVRVFPRRAGKHTLSRATPLTLCRSYPVNDFGSPRQTKGAPPPAHHFNRKHWRSGMPLWRNFAPQAAPG
jgi:hypothetical protein